MEVKEGRKIGIVMTVAGVLEGEGHSRKEGWTQGRISGRYDGR